MDIDTPAPQFTDARLAQTVLHALPAMVAITDAAGRIAHCNPACERLSGRSAAQLQGRSLWDALVAPGERAGFEQVFSSWLSGATASPHEAATVDGDGVHRPIAWTPHLLRGDTGEQQMLLIGLDLSDLRHAEACADERLQAIDEAVCRGTMGEVLRELAHELNQPLSAVLNFSRGAVRLLERGAGDIDVRDVFERIGGQSERAAQMVRSVRDRLRKDPAEAGVPMSMGELAQDVLRLLSPEARIRGIAPELERQVQNDRVWVDPELVSQLLVELVRRALRSVEGTEQDQRLAIALTTDGPRLEVAVHAHRSGEPPPHVGEPGRDVLEMTDPALAFCERIVRGYGGELSTSGATARGYAARFSLPLVE